MKKIVNLSLITVLTVGVFTSCSKKDRLDMSDAPKVESKTAATVVDESSYLKQDWAEVVYSDPNSFVVETIYGYSIVKSSAQPSESTILFGDFGQEGSRSFLSTTGKSVDGEVAKFDLSYADAESALGEFASKQKGSEMSIVKSNSSEVKIPRPAK